MQVINDQNDAQIDQSLASALKEQQWKTTLGSTMANILGSTKEVIEFDRARENAKNYRHDKFFLDSYMHKLAVLQTRMSQKKRELEKEVEDWEKNYFIQNDNLPTYDDFQADSIMKEKLKQIKTAKAIMKLKG